MNNWASIIISDSRTMPEVADAAIDLVVTSPPYWHIKDYGVPGQIGYGQSLHDYLKDLYRVWRECFRVLREGARLCINIGDQFARAAIYGRYKVIPLHAEFINQCEGLGFDFLGAVIWQKRTTMNPSGGAVVMGSYPFPPNGIVELDYEFIQIFKKPGASKKVSAAIKEASRLSKEEWKEYFAGHWFFGGVKQQGHEAMFPEELPRRLIRMFTFAGDTVLDPFAGSGTTVKAALDLGRNALGYEINANFLAAVPQKLGAGGLLAASPEVRLIRSNKRIEELPQIDYTPAIRDAEPRPAGRRPQLTPEALHKVTRIIDERTLGLEDGSRVNFLGVRIDQTAETLEYLKKRILGKSVFIRDDKTGPAEGRAGYVYLKNRIFINAHLIKSGLGSPDPAVEHKLQKKFIRLHEQRRRDEGSKS